MAQTGPRVLLTIAGAGILGIGLLFHIIGLATPNWELYTYPSVAKYNVGLWGGCVQPQCTNWGQCVQSLCTSYPAKTTEIEVCEAFAIIGLLLGAGGLGLVLVHSFMILTGKPKNVMLPSLSALAGCLACGAVIIVVGVWGGKQHDQLAQLFPDAEIGYSLILSIIGGALMGGGGVFVFVVSKIQS